MSENVAPETLDRGRYRIERELGVGGTATVYLATDTRIGVHRAIKLLSREFARSKQNRARFMNEAHAQAGLKHNNVLMVHDVIDDDQGLYMVMELAESDSLGARVSGTGPMSPKEVAEVGITVGGALSVAHAAGVIHRDIKPANILVDRHGVLKLADFGIARVIDREGELTRTGTVMGTWAYMPPEQRENTHVADARSDIYALGVTLHALLTGRHSPNLHNQEAYAEVFAEVNGELARIIQRATRLYPEDRYPRMDAMVAELRAIVSSLDGPSLFDGDVTDPQGIVALTGAPPPPRRPAQPAPAEARPSGPVAPVVAPTGSTAVPLAPNVDTWLPEEGNTAPPSVLAPSPRPQALLVAVAALAFLVVAVGGAVLVPRLLDDKATAPPAERPDPPAADLTATPDATAPAIAKPGEDEVPAPIPDEVPAEAPAAVATASPPPTRSPPPEPTPSRRVITVIPDSSSPAQPTAATDGGSSAPADVTGTVVVRTVPSGATVSEAGRPLSARANGEYKLPVGSHILDIRSAGGESTRVPVLVKPDQRVDICYSFDTNSTCGSAP